MAEVKKIDWRTLCQDDDGNYFDPEHVEYQFSNGKEFKRKKDPFYVEEDE